jgi:hypothetical protein
MSKKSDSNNLLALVPKNAPDLDALTNGDVKLSDSIRLIFHYLFMLKLSIWRCSPDDRPLYYKWGWIPLNIKTLRNITFKNRTSQTLEYMVKNNLLEVKTHSGGNKSYLIGKISTLYRIPGNLYEKKEIGFLYRKEKVTTKLLVKKVLEYKEQLKTEKITAQFKIYQPEYATLIKMVEQFQPICTDVKQLLLDGEINTQDNCDELQMLLDTFNSDQDRCTTCEFGSRFFSPFTNLKSSYRSLFRFKKFQDVEHISIDVANSQWFFLAILISKPILIKRYLKEFKIITPLLDGCHEAHDVQKFIQLTGGGWYEYWAEKRWPEEFLLDPVGVRSKAKSELSYILFGKVKTYPSTPNYEALVEAKVLFQKLFPRVWKVIVAIKELGKEQLPFMNQFYYDKKTGKYRGNALSHKNMSALLQRLESRILIGTISSRLIKKKIPFITIHDSIITPSIFEGIVDTEIEVFFKWYKLPAPKLKTDIL